MFFLIPEDKRVLIFYILVILTGIFLDYLNIIATEKFVGIVMLAGILFFVIRTLIFGYCTQNCDEEEENQKK
ncbi:hypothetical protein Arnit_2445 [Arcobacter nitrofigilis DSM 7299]|uniref:Uncharacterized protein n=1 Tax=Arcobacter nitrofigilis (strain ATCC 33309 / DSM 7299 / CCUG 15893 / LMG 7604 / NCTC 12251 / CI) TaxID=572480 RepID=D5UZ92_ARCNC|nr:hypothetical protein [Arcobacter nitrofigilis]ADG94095.1 hypothetical protein Arnit_2445 [Arcobacter nitrofigilis DSM 7299]